MEDRCWCTSVCLCASHKVFLTYAEGPIADQPSSTADLRLILGGKFLDNGEILNGLSLLSLILRSQCMCDDAIVETILGC